ncbi:hypothetical protein KGM_214356 [Danaus plexippus plexippus]|uniref:Uncharacterized protein n=2 Tax=Danaus plexippus TaxID=13037 RepID=A0A212FNN4_DANPL|nr:hypothetical protein KGM_214356 [Danaus plexippus plexippus]
MLVDRLGLFVEYILYPRSVHTAGREGIAAVPHAVVAGRRLVGWWAVASISASAQRSPLGWAMGSSQRLAAVAAVSHAKHYYNHTTPDVARTVDAHYTVNILFVSATLCGVLVAVCAACWRRSSSNKPEEVAECGVYTVSADARLTQDFNTDEIPGPPPAYESVVISEGASTLKDSYVLEDVKTEPCNKCKIRIDSGLPSYDAAVMLRDTKL